jgi:proteasome activator subunit 4
MTVCRFNDDNAYPAPIDSRFQGCVDILREAFTSQEYWRKLFRYASEERGRTGESRFAPRAALLYKLASDQFSVDALNAALPVLDEFLVIADENRYQLAIAEMVAGLAAGSKHWSRKNIAYLWSKLIPMLQQAIENATPQTLSHWDKCIEFCCVSLTSFQFLIYACSSI